MTRVYIYIPLTYLPGRRSINSSGLVPRYTCTMCIAECRYGSRILTLEGVDGPRTNPSGHSDAKLLELIGSYINNYFFVGLDLSILSTIIFEMWYFLGTMTGKWPNHCNRTRTFHSINLLGLHLQYHSQWAFIFYFNLLSNVHLSNFYDNSLLD